MFVRGERERDSRGEPNREERFDRRDATRKGERETE